MINDNILSIVGSIGRGALEYRSDKSVVTDDEFLDSDRSSKEVEKDT